MAPSISTNPLLSLLLFSFLLSLSIFHPLTTAQPLYQNCETALNYTSNSTYASNLKTLLASLPSNASRNNGFYNTTVGTNQDPVYGLVLCRGDVTPARCQSCVDEAINMIKWVCSNSKIASIWYAHCQLRYSDKRFFSLMEDAGKITLYNTARINNPTQFAPFLNDLLSNLSNRAANDPSLGMFATEKTKFMGSQDVYGLVQCTRDLSMNDCSSCLEGALRYLMGCCSSYIGARVLTTSCNLRFELYYFYTDSDSDSGPTPAPPAAPNPTFKGKKGKKSRVVAIGLAVTFVGLVLLGCCIFHLLRRRRKPQEARKQQSPHSFLNNLGVTNTDLLNIDICGGSPGENQELPFIDFGTIQHSTNNFSFENKLGQGGFGAVYKGVLADGKEIAVKRLSIGSSQGLKEFKNEVILISKLQHKNLVRLVFYCMEKEEKLLIYEYMPNKSLDFFLFDQIKRAQLTWRIRHNIVNGIARGLLYLHEDSCLKVIHRDLKASNVLLDYEMNPKISDFGLARTFRENHSEANTNKVIGTYGYMAPEYAMDGLFSVKSDVFSFGVLLIEILSGRKNSRSYLAENAQSLLAYAWRLWCDGKVMELLDPVLIDSCPMDEVLRFVHIGFLCIQEDATDRPTMSSVVLMLGSKSMTLPHPTEPPLYEGKRKVISEQSPSNAKTSSNEVVISEVEPR
ncbi:putative receptor-like protein kinase isoform X1 [Cinnamomum micranthum f. kanehirae]|uniref:non-specific serine/threonine protein kinase n=1 Tax=Cinnamomum micranthum f. kanehirae TaxID=337451 RepID=A0A3S4PBQ8_9MAGN|nr:putative receptor-like protein kinase isoform X1 [Cinnamomum micranthum f. kanehirae]